MSITRFITIPFAVVVAVTATAAPFARANAQGDKPAAPDAADPKAAVPPVRYDSAFARYRPNAEAEVGAWRDANDHVGRIGGWRVYGREAIEDPKTSPPPAAGSWNEGGEAAKAKHGQPHRGPR
jgi:hypothetical protein